jgi:quercetin dioxygenase-like cupin family protein
MKDDPIRRCAAFAVRGNVQATEVVIMSKTHRSLGAVAVAVLLASSVAAAQGHVIQSVGEAQWGAAPPMLPAGAQIAVLAGDPGKTVPYAVRLKFPANYAIPAHSHPSDEHVVVVSGALTMGMGDKLDRTAGTTLSVGGFALMPANMNHFAYTRQETTILLYGVGPVEFKYVNPSDDPRHATRKPQ